MTFYIIGVFVAIISYGNCLGAEKNEESASDHVLGIFLCGILSWASVSLFIGVMIGSVISKKKKEK